MSIYLIGTMLLALDVDFIYLVVLSSESFVKGFFTAYLGLSPYYGVLTEQERNKGFVDIYLKKAPNIEDEIIEGLIELKYIPKSKFSQEGLNRQIEQAKKQLEQYKPSRV